MFHPINWPVSKVVLSCLGKARPNLRLSLAKVGILIHNHDVCSIQYYTHIYIYKLNMHTPRTQLITHPHSAQVYSAFVHSKEEAYLPNH